MTIPLQNHIIYGPVASRRLGRSLGINCFIPKSKICSLNCLYCQYGYTRIGENELEDPSNYFTTKEILNALKNSLSAMADGIDAITLSGNGEATAHPDFPSLVDGIVNLRDTYTPGIRTVILSNSTFLGRAEVRAATGQLDVRIMKLDCGTEACFRRYNHPVIEVTLEEIVSNLCKLKDPVIQTLFSGGPAGNASPDQLKAWIEKLLEIRPHDVQIYSLARPFPSRSIEKIGRPELEDIALQVRAEGIDIAVY